MKKLMAILIISLSIAAGSEAQTSSYVYGGDNKTIVSGEIPPTFRGQIAGTVLLPGNVFCEACVGYFDRGIFRVKKGTLGGVSISGNNVIWNNGSLNLDTEEKLQKKAGMLCCVDMEKLSEDKFRFGGYFDVIGMTMEMDMSDMDDMNGGMDDGGMGGGMGSGGMDMDMDNKKFMNSVHAAFGIEAAYPLYKDWLRGYSFTEFRFSADEQENRSMTELSIPILADGKRNYSIKPLILEYRDGAKIGFGGGIKIDKFMGKIFAFFPISDDEENNGVRTMLMYEISRRLQVMFMMDLPMEMYMLHVRLPLAFDR